jgi:Surface antigen variable number repeat
MIRPVFLPPIFLVALALFLPSASHAQLTDRLTRCLPYPTFAQEIHARQVDLAGNSAADAAPALVFDQIFINASPDLSPQDRAGLEQAIRSSAKLASPGWLDELQGAYIEGYLKDRGYFRASSVATSETLKTDSQGVHVAVTVVIIDAEQYRMGEVSFRPADPTQPLFFDQEQLASRFYLNVGDIFSAEAIRRSLIELRRLYGSNGFVDFVATPITELHEPAHQVDVTMELDEQRQFRIGKVTVDTTSDQVRAAIAATLAAGTIFNSDLLSKVLKDNATQLPPDVSLEDVELHHHVKAGTVDITFHLNPCPTLQD